MQPTGLLLCNVSEEKDKARSHGEEWERALDLWGTEQKIEESLKDVYPSQEESRAGAEAGVLQEHSFSSPSSTTCYHERAHFISLSPNSHPLKWRQTAHLSPRQDVGRVPPRWDTPHALLPGTAPKAQPSPTST